MRKILVPILAAVLLSVGVLVVVGIATPSNAATVDGVGIAASKVDGDLHAISTNAGYLCYLNATQLIRTRGQAGLGAVRGSTAGTYSQSFIATVMDQEITNEIISQRARSLGIPAPGPAELGVARTDLLGSMDSTLSQVASSQYACPGNGASILGSMPYDFVTAQIRAQADSEALLAKEGGIKVDAASLLAYYQQHQTDFEKVCVSGILVADQATASDVAAKIAGGLSFASAASQYSLDASKAQGGALGCFSPGSAQYSAVNQQVGPLAIGQVSSPQASQGGQYVLFTVTERTPVPFAEVESIVRRTVIAKDASQSSSAIGRVLREASVSVNPSYGQWKTSLSGAGVVPPAAPPASSLLSPQANSPLG